jgi:Uma2 family endonuclease
LRPDILFIAKDRLHIIADHAVLGAPDLVVEVLSPSTRHFDLGRKRDVCFAKGVRELWIADIEETTLLHHAQEAGGWRITRLGRQDTLCSHVLPGFEVSLMGLA